VSSSCRYHYAGMSYASACKTTPRTPSTNVPIHCPFCPPVMPSGSAKTIWKYNARDGTHPDPLYGGWKPAPPPPPPPPPRVLGEHAYLTDGGAKLGYCIGMDGEVERGE
ncbi:hypothetical protein C8Q70DRAFT_926837, partial [Cubamyces menziesii]